MNNQINHSGRMSGKTVLIEKEIQEAVDQGKTVCVFTYENGELKRRVRTKTGFSLIEAGIQFTGALKQLENK